MNAQDNLYNDLRQILKNYGVEFYADLVRSVGDGFLRHLTSAPLFSLGLNVGKYFRKDRHNRVIPAPYPKFGAFWGRKALAKTQSGSTVVA